MSMSGWCQSVPGARIPHEACTFALCSCECHRGSDPSKTKGFAVPLGVSEGRIPATEADPLATNLSKQKGG